MLSRLNLKTKLICGFTLIAMIAGAIGAAGIRGTYRLSQHIKQVEDYDLFSNAADDSLECILQHRRHEKDFFLNIDDPAKRAEALEKFRNSADELGIKLKLLGEMAARAPRLNQDERQLITVLPEQHRAYLEGFRKVVARIEIETDITPLMADKLMIPFKQNIYDLESGIKRIKDRGDELAADTTTTSVREAHSERMALSVAVVIGFVLAVVLGVLVSGKITMPLAQITSAADELKQGNSMVEIGYRSGDELGDLAESFRQMLDAQRRKVEMAQAIAAGNLDAPLELASDKDTLGRALLTMTAEMKKYIRELTETTAAKERIQSELRVATDIQTSLLPRIFPAFPDRPEFDIYAAMDPAKEVGGDFYDFFFIDGEHLCFLIADVADKGVPAALYMMVAKTLIKTEAQRIGAPDEILSRVNAILAADNENCMFVTVFCAVLNTGTGELRFANAGHNPPLICNKGQGFDYVKIKVGFVLGPIADSVYVTETVTLKENDIFFLYTDGVTEAKNPEAELYGEKRLREALNRGEVSDLSELVHFIRAEVEHHANGAPQSDDVTMLAVRFKGRGNA
jgi:serine phosphatase RsbU (regulator of sigma subunit)